VPETDFDPRAVAFHTAMLERTEQILYAGAEKVKPYAQPTTRG
jgi:non-haem Fe2+, alpha-ketoglutarate-dependent halogenase